VDSVLPFPTEAVREASAVLLIPRLDIYLKGRREYIPSRSPVFYNPFMAFNRDVAVLAVRAYQRRVHRCLDVCEPFTGCGVRGIRFAQEVPHVQYLVVNDINPHAVALTRLNVAQSGLSETIQIQHLDAHDLLSRYARPKNRFDVIDLDPFGSPSPFLDSAVRAIKRGGLLAVTATDMAPLCGVKPSACIRKYQGTPLRTEYCHELAVRLLLNALVLAAATHDLGVTVLLSHSTDHYIRVYTQIAPGAQKANDALHQRGYILHCFHCLNRTWTRGLSPVSPRVCGVCGGDLAVAGPLWLGRLVDSAFCDDMREDARSLELNDRRRVLRLLNALLTEAEGPPTYYVVDALSKNLGLPGLSKAALIERLVASGFHAMETHFNPRGIRSNAPIAVIAAHCRALSKG
jgi:tRNA (guanine26-N2/guanine27-N2)-dimethyltransferase